ncbi:MAG: ATP-binding protein [Betaproteobacteria bacterium AqS2]|uniref:ATP-binding protein n=1 Tax=Candidatus Amphirhobacter heronislandensis TaxID=1732024 RepID=A0A930UGX9_9GAMM|nr:ATP-binding protein [Betaproteobacteria bacterium AqS2]
MVSKFNPFTPGTGHVPPLLAGRAAEVELLTNTLGQLRGPRVRRTKLLVDKPLPPIRICGPRGVGKTTLLSWLNRQPQFRDIRIIWHAYLSKARPTDVPLRSLLFNMFRELSALERFMGSKALRAVTISMENGEANLAYERMAEFMAAKGPLLMAFDEIPHFDLDSLAAILRTNQRLIEEGYPLAMLLIGTPGLDAHLRKADASFIDRSTGMYINLISDEATRDAMRVPLEQEGFAVQPDALEAMAAQADNYPYFTQVVGAAVWDAMRKSGHKKVDVGIVEQSAEKAESRQNELHYDSYGMLVDNGLLYHSRRVMDLLESSGGSASPEVVFNLLAEHCTEEDEGGPEAILDGLQLDGLIWTVDGVTRTGRPSLFRYCQEQRLD